MLPACLGFVWLVLCRFRGTLAQFRWAERGQPLTSQRATSEQEEGCVANQPTSVSLLTSELVVALALVVALVVATSSEVKREEQASKRLGSRS